MELRNNSNPFLPKRTPRSLISVMRTPKPLLYLMLGASLFGQFISSSDAQQAGKKLSIAVIPKGTTHVFWKSVEAGARQAAQELGIEMTWKGPLKEDDRAQQISIVEQFVSKERR